MKISLLSAALVLTAALSTMPVLAQTAATADQAATAAGKKGAKKVKDATDSAATQAKAAAPVAAKKAHKGGPTANASAAEIADAKSKGLVWVNTGTGVYHASGEYFGATKEGKFMTVAEAQKGGFRAAKDSPIGKKAKPAPAAK